MNTIAMPDLSLSRYTGGKRLRLLWVTPWPIMPPFAGSAGCLLKSHFAIMALSRQYEIDLVAFAEPGRCAEVDAQLKEFWRETPIRRHVIEYAPNPSPIQAGWKRRFQLGVRVETRRLSALMDDLDWRRPDRLVVMGDIVFAPLAHHYGSNLLLSPHDCISEMLRMHFLQALPRRTALKYYAQYRIARYYERAFYHEALLVHLVTHRDRLMLQRINPTAHYHVAPYRDRTSLSAANERSPEYDVLIWTDLRIASAARGAKEFVEALVQSAQGPHRPRVLLVGRVEREAVSRCLGTALPEQIDYGARLEDERGVMRRGRITVIPDSGGTGIKTRLINVLASGGCTACLYSQTEGIEWIADIGAINAHTLADLARSVWQALQTGSVQQTAARGAELFERHYSAPQLEGAWFEMIERALHLRETLHSGNPLPSLAPTA